MPEPLSPTTGWGVLHLFCTPLPDVDREAVIAAVKALQADDHQVVSIATLGHKGDAGFMALGPDLWRLRRFQTDLQAAGLAVVDSFVSLTELFADPVGWSCTTPPAGGTGAIDCSIATLPANGAAIFTLVVNVDPSVASGTIITNTATISPSSFRPTIEKRGDWRRSGDRRSKRDS